MIFYSPHDWKNSYNEAVVVAHAQKKIAFLPGESLEPKESNFWLSFFFSDVTKGRNPAQGASTDLHEHFSKNARPESKAAFEAGQKKLISEFDAALAAITPPMEENLNLLKEKYALQSHGHAYRIETYIKNNPEKFALGSPLHNQAFRAIFHFEKTAFEAARHPGVNDKNTLFLALAQILDKEYGWAFTRGKVSNLVSKWMKDQKDELKSAMIDKGASAPRIDETLLAVKPGAIKIVSGNVSEAMLSDTGRGRIERTQPNRRWVGITPSGSTPKR